MIAIVDYAVGNLFSLKSSLAAIGAEAVVTGEADTLRQADKILLPGVGAFGDAADKLHATGLAAVIAEEAKSGKPLMGICLGMQLLFEKSFEYGEHTGLGLLEGEIRPISGVIPAGLKIPHMGWNSLSLTPAGKAHPLFSRTNCGDFVYFVHSYYAAGRGGEGLPTSAAATADYGAPLTAAAVKDNIMGCQFHPEKSGRTGLAILKSFCEIV